MDHLDLAGVLTTPLQWNTSPFEQQDAIYLSSSRQMLEPIMEETSEDEEYALNSWQQYEQQGSSDADECEGTTESESVCGGAGGNGGASFWSSTESDTGSVIRVEINRDNDSTSERDFLCPAKRPRRCEESLAQSTNEEEVVLRRPYTDLKNSSLERFLNYENFARDSWGANSQQRSSVGSRRAFDDFFSDSDSLSYNSLSRSSSLIQFESLERQLLMQEQHASMNNLGNSSPSLLSFETNEDTSAKATSNSANNSGNNSRRGSQSSLLKKYESLDGRLHQTYYDLDKLNFDNRGSTAVGDGFSRATTLKITSHMAELRSDSESSSEGSESSSRPQSLLSPTDCNENGFLMKKFNKTNCQQNKKGKSSAENLSEDSGYCEPSLGFVLRRSKSQSLLKNYEKFSEEEEEMENKSLIHNKPQTFIELNEDEHQTNNKHSTINVFKNIATSHQETIKSPPLSPQLEFIRHKQRTEAHSPSPVSSEVSTSSSASSHSTNSNNSIISCSSSSASSTSSATTCASKASFTWLMPSAVATAANTARQSLTSTVLAQEENLTSQISINDLRAVQTSNEENVQIFSGKLKNNSEKFSSSNTSASRIVEYVQLVEKENECLECKNILEEYELEYECRNCVLKQKNLCCQKCIENLKHKEKINKNSKEIPEGNSESVLSCKNCGEYFLLDIKPTAASTTTTAAAAAALSEKVRKKIIEQQIELLSDDSGGKFVNTEIIERNSLNEFDLECGSCVSTPESLKKGQSCENSPKTLRKYKNYNSSCSSTPDTPRRSLKTASNKTRPLTFGYSASSDSDYSPLRLRKNSHNLMPSWPAKTSSVPNELNTIGRKKKLKKAKTVSFASSKHSAKNNISEALPEDNDSISSNEELDLNLLNIKRSLSWSFHQNLKLETPAPSLCAETKNLNLLHQSYHNLAILNLDCEEQAKGLERIMAEGRISSDYETEIVCKNNFLLDELSAHFDRTASILNDKPIDQTDSYFQPTKPSQAVHSREDSNSSCSANESSEAEQIQHVSLVIRNPPARQAVDKVQKVNSLTQDYSFATIMQGGKTFDQDPTILKTSYAQSLEKCNFDCREFSAPDMGRTRSMPKRRFHSQANSSKKKNLVSSTPNLNAYDFNHQDDIEDDMFVSSAHTSMHQLPLSQTQKPLGILLPAGSRTSFGKEVSFCPVVSKYCWQEQSSEECNEANEEQHPVHDDDDDDDSEDELLDNADATVIYNTKENENIASKYNEEFLRRDAEKNNNQEQGNDVVINNHNDELINEQKAGIKEIITTKQQLDTTADIVVAKENTRTGNETQQREETPKSTINKQSEIETEEHKERSELLTLATQTQSSNELPVTTVSLTTNVNNKALNAETTDSVIEKEQNKRVNNSKNTNNTSLPNAVVAPRPLSIQLPILSEPPINRAHHILYASQQMLDNFQRQQQNEEFEHYKSQSTQNLSKMSGKTVDLQQQPASNSKLNNNNEIKKSKFKHEEKHPNSKGFLSRFANGFRFSLRRNKKKLQQKENQQSENDIQEQSNKSNGRQANQMANKSNSLPAAHKQADFIHIPLKGPLPENRNGNAMAQTNGNSSNNGTVKNTTVLLKQKGAKTIKDTNDKQQKVTGKPPIPPQQQQQQQQHQHQQNHKMQCAQSSQQQQPLVEVGLSRFYTGTESNNPPAAHTVMQDFLTSERGLYNDFNNQQQFTTTTTSQSCVNNQLLTSEKNDGANMTAVNANNTATYEFTSPSRATVSQKTQMFNNLSRKSEQPKIGLIETNLDTHETIITGKTRSLINIGSNQQQRYAGNKRLHTNTNSHNHHQHQYNRNHLCDGNEADDDDGYDDNDDDEVVVRPDGTVVVIKNAGTNGSSASASSQAAQIVSVRRPHKSMEFLLDKENQKDVMSKYTSQKEYDFHRMEIEDMREEKKNDIENAKEGLLSLLCMDMQAVKLIPQLKASASYYKMKLQVHNFTIYNVITHKSENYVWDETEGNLIASTFATIVVNHLKKEILNTPNVHHFIIYSDGCFYQNRNVVLSNALLSFCVENNVTIEHKYLIMGHTQMECDSTHSLIQRKINNKNINLPSELIELMKNSRKNPYPLTVHHLYHDYFQDYENLPMRYASIRPGKKIGDPKVNMIRVLAYDPTGYIYYKINIKADYQLLPQKSATRFKIRRPKLLHPQRLKISKKKWQHLQDLKTLLPADCHYFYDNIPFE